MNYDLMFAANGVNHHDAETGVEKPEHVGANVWPAVAVMYTTAKPLVPAELVPWTTAVAVPAPAAIVLHVAPTQLHEAIPSNA